MMQPIVKFDNRLYRVYKHSTGCQTRLTRQPVWQPAVSCIQPVVKPVVKPVWQPLDNRLDVCLHDTADCQTGCTTGL